MQKHILSAVLEATGVFVIKNIFSCYYWKRFFMSNSSYMIVLYICRLIRNKVNRQIEHLFVYCFCISHISLSVIFICETSSFTVSHLTQVISTLDTFTFINRFMSPGYVCICQQVILFWCSRPRYTWGQLGSQYALVTW